MQTEDLKGLVIFIGIVGMYTFVLFGCMTRSLARVDRALDDRKYVN